jgi:hypothetical protein
MNARHFLPLAATFAFGVSTLCAQTSRPAPQPQVPARYTKVTDSLGFIWDVTPGGNINNGSNAFSNSFGMSVNGDSVSFQTAMMSADGQEYFFTANLDGLLVTRRVRVNVKDSYCRYFETLTNTTGEARNVELVIRARPRGRMQADGGDAGDRQMPFPDKDSGIIIGGNPKASGQPQPSFVWMLASPGAKVRPGAQIEQSTFVKATYPVVVPPGASVSIAHAAAQRALDPKTDRKRTAEILAPMALDRLLAGVPVKERKEFLNYAPTAADGDGDPSRALAALQALLEAADITREKADTVLLDAATKVSGTVSGGTLAIETEFGKADVPFADIAGIAGGAGVQRTVRVFLRDGEILAGTVTGDKFAMTTDSGLHFEIDLAQIPLLALRKDAADGKPPRDTAALLTTQRGDCLALAEKSAAELQAATPFGMLRIPLAEIANLEYTREPFPGHLLTLTDRSRLPVMLRGDEWQLATVRFGKVKIVPQSVRELRNTALKGKPPATEDHPGFANCELAGGHRLAGVIDLPKLHLASTKSTTPLDTTTITTLSREAREDGTALVKVTLADGQELSGQLVESTLPIRSGQRVWRVPAAHILSVNVPPPAKPKDEAPAPPATPAVPAKPRPSLDDIINAPPEAPPAPALKKP